MITWEKSNVPTLKDYLFGYADNQDKEEEIARYRIWHTTLSVEASGYYVCISGIRLATIEDAKQAAELIEKGRRAE